MTRGILTAACLASLLAWVPVHAWVIRKADITVRSDTGFSADELEAVAGVASQIGADHAVVEEGMIRLLSVSRGDASTQEAPEGYGYPMAAATVDPDESVALIGGLSAGVLAVGRVVMAERTAALLGGEVGDDLVLETWEGRLLTAKIGAVAPDLGLEWFELLLPAGTAVGPSGPNRIELWNVGDVRIAETLLRLSLPDDSATFEIYGDTPRSPSLPLVVVKEKFGEIAIANTPAGLAVDQQWMAEHIVEVEMPRLGRFRCHRAVAPYLQNAVAELVDLRLDWLINGDDFQQSGGCFVPELFLDPTGRVSRHVWGIALRVNPSTNPLGGPIRLEERVGAVLEAWGFAWGATFPVPEGAYFEWVGAPLDHHRCSEWGLSKPAEGSWEVYPREGGCSSS